MVRKYVSYFKRFDWVLFFSAIFLMILGLSAIYGINLNLENQSFLNFKKQMFFVVSGTVIMFAMCLLDYRVLKNYSRFLYLVGIVLLVSVLLFGNTIRGTKGWFELGVFNFQPVELVKLLSIIFIARYFTQWARFINLFRHIFISGFGVFILVFMVLIQPDFGSAIVMFFIWFLMTLIVGIKRSHLILMLVCFVIMGTFFWMFFLKAYQKDRILAFLDPHSDPLGRGYNITQALVAVGSGGLFGKGLGSGSQTQLKFLPESQTDFISAVIAEELGFVGMSLMIIFFALMIYRIAMIARNAGDDFGQFLVLGVLSAFFIQIIINIGMNLGFMPVTGISLPFVSYGGSYLWVSLMMLGIVQGVAIHSRKYV